MIYRMMLPCLLMLLTVTDALSQGTTVTCDVSAECAVGNGSHTPYYLTANRHAILSTRSNTGYVRAASQLCHDTRSWHIDAVLDVQAAIRPDYSRCYLQQAYAAATFRQWLTMWAGAREVGPTVRDALLSSGSTVWSGNSRPIPQLCIGTAGFVTIPGTHGWIETCLDISYGHCLDSDYLQDRYDDYVTGLTGYGRSYMVKDVWYHQKKLYLRSDHRRPWVFTVGIEHAVQFGGTSVNYIDASLNGDFSPSLKDFFTVLMPRSGDGQSASGDQSFVYGNHIGCLTLMLERQWGDNGRHRIGAYVEDLFEDGSGIRKGNGWDGLWGLEYHNARTDALVRGIVIEYLQTTDQSGPIHWAPHDFGDQQIAAQMPAAATGADDYYNNYFYTGYTHYGQCCGSPLLKSPIYNTDHYLRFTDTRVQAWHLGIDGSLWTSSQQTSSQQSSSHRALSYRLLFSHRRAFGTYFVPSPAVRRCTSALAELTYLCGPWQCALAYAFDEGDLFGHAHALDVRLRRHF